MKVDGACHCGEIKFIATISDGAIVCHCEDCQVLSGSAFRINVKAAASTFSVVKGTLEKYTKVAESGDVRMHAFCSNCATPIYSSVETNPEFLFLRIGAIHQRNQITPAVQIWKDSALCNFKDLEGVVGSGKQQALQLK